MSFLLVILVLAALSYAVFRIVRSQSQRPQTRVIGPDDDPEFLWRLNHGDKPR